MKKRKNSLLGNYIYNSIYSSIAVIFPLITVPYLSRILLSDGLGKVNYAHNIVAWFLLFAQLGIPRYGVREIAKVKSNESKLKTTFNELFAINFISTFVCVTVFVIMIISVPYFKSRMVLYWVTGIQLFLNILNVDWFYQGLEEYRYITNRSLCIKIISVILMLIFVKYYEDYIIYALIQSLAVAGNNVFNYIHLKKYVKISFKELNLKPHISPIFILLSTQLAVSIYTLLDTTMLGIWCSDNVIGYYSNSQKIIRIINTFTTALGGVMLPRLVKYYAEGNYTVVKNLSEKALKIIVTVCVPSMVGIVLLSPEIVDVLFGQDFTPCIKTLQVFAPFILFTTVGNLYGTQLLMVLGEEKKLFHSVIIGAIINFCLNIILIRHFEQNGVACASVITEFVVMIIQIKMVSKHIKLKIGVRNITDTLLMVGLMIATVLMVKRILASPIFSLILSTVSGCLVYFGIGVIIKNESVSFILSTFYKKIKER